MATRSKMAVAAALIFGTASAALAEPPDVPNYYDTHPWAAQQFDAVRNQEIGRARLHEGRNVATRRAGRLREGRNVAIPRAVRPFSVEERLLFERANGNPHGG